MFTGVDHPAIACYDVKKQIDWYCRQLGMSVVASNQQDPPSVVVGFASGIAGTMIELMPAREKGDKPVDVARFAPGIRHLAFRVASFQQAFEQLKSAGVQFIGEPGNAVGGGKIISFRDPEGNELQIVER